MVQVTGIEGLGQSLLDRQDEGFRKARRRNRRSRALETGLNLALSLGDGIFKRKYENRLDWKSRFQWIEKSYWRWWNDKKNLI